MTITDPIADFLTRIRNAIAARHTTVDIPESTLKREIARTLLRERYISRVVRVRDAKHSFLRVYLKYNSEGKSAIDGLERVSRPGRRVYYGVNEIPRVLNGLGTMILTTPRGIVTDRQARQLHVGGEPLCVIW
ncbi:MAG: 30S ribosomal protein S8 [Calditrichaeota bacterium]|nr:30S ribosomal protein S8 [Calditrichota bacterium]